MFETFIPMAPEKKFDSKATTYFILNSLGLYFNRDSWVYNSCKTALKVNIDRMVQFYNEQASDYKIQK